MFTMRDYMVEAQRRQDEMAEARHDSLVKGLVRGSENRIGRLLLLVGERLLGGDREQSCPTVETGSCTTAGRPGVSVA